jgi:hypothetical protein
LRFCKQHSSNSLATLWIFRAAIEEGVTFHGDGWCNLLRLIYKIGIIEGSLHGLEKDQEPTIPIKEADTVLRGAIIGVLGENIVDSYLSITTRKNLWDALEAKFGVPNAGSELYAMEQYYDYKMTDERSFVEQAHEIQSIAKEFEQFT